MSPDKYPMPDQPYEPIDCSLHDRLESAATLRQTIQIIYHDSDGTQHEIEDRLTDVFAKDGEEFAKTTGGNLIRLDRLVRVDGVDFT
jgi:Rho-binding antiterminator